MNFYRSGNGSVTKFCTLFVLVVSLFASPRTYAQLAGATLTGSITDTSGAVVPTATISIKNSATGVTRDLTVNSDGLYSAPNILPGTYEVTVSASGFSTQVITGVLLEVGASRTLNATLSVGQVAQSVSVTGEAPDLQTTSSSISGEVTQQTVVDLPLNGRDWSSLATLEPGVISIRAQLSNTTANLRANRGFGNALSDSGHRPNQNNYTLNGISLMDHANSPPSNSIGGTLGVDAIQEFNVVTTNYTAETGRASGASINAIEKSGTKEFHGTVFEFIRNAALDARNYFDTPVIPPFRRNQFGAAIGGPIKKDKTFFFFNYEGIRMYQSLSQSDTVPTAAARAGNLCSVPTTGTCTPNTVPVSAAAATYLPFWPLPNAGLVSSSNGDIGNWKGAGFQTVSENFFTARGDHKFSDKDSLALSWLKDSSPYEFTDALVDVFNDSNQIRQVGTIEETHIFGPSLVNTARFGYSYVHTIGGLPGGALNPLASNTNIGFLPGVSPAQVSITGITGELSGLGSYGHYEHPWESFQFYDDLFVTRGTHSLKFGFVMERMHDDDYNHPLPAGSFSFLSLSSFLTNQPSSALASLPTIQTVYLRQTLFGGYVQDDWRIRPNLTLNLGLRYEMTTIPNVTTNNLLLHPLLNSGIAVPANQLWNRNATLRNFEPRVGFAWDPFRDGKTAVRGAFGIYDSLPLSYEYSDLLASAIPFAQWASVNLATAPAGTAFPSGPNGLTLAKYTPNNEMSPYIEPNPGRSYVMNWNLNIQRTLTPSTTLKVGYVGSHGVHMPFLHLNVNWVLPAQVNAGAGYIWPNPVSSGTLRNPDQASGTLDAFSWTNSASYSGLQISLVKRMSHGFQVQASYTDGACFDDGSGGGPSNPLYLNGGTFVSPAFNMRGPCDFNVRQVLSINYVWQIPTPKFGGEIGSRILGGWQLSGIYSLSTGEPFSVSMGGNTLSTVGAPTDAPNILAGPGCDNPVNSGNVNSYINLSCFSPPFAPASIASQCVNFTAPVSPAPSGQVYCRNLFGNAGRGILTGPGIDNFDFSIFKNFPIQRISEAFNVQFRAELFNIFNHPNFQAPLDNLSLFSNTGAAQPGAGLIDSTTTSSRQIQFGLKVIF